MGWVRLEDTFCEHPKVETLDDLPFRVHVKALCYANRNLTDGYIPLVAARAMGGSRHKSATQALVSAGLWEHARGGFRIHDFLDYQPARESVMLRRESDRKRKASSTPPPPDGIDASRTHPGPPSLLKEETGTTPNDVDALLKGTHLGRMS